MKLGKNAFLITNGCPENRIDLARMQEYLKENGWIITKAPEDADLVLFNSCGLTQYAEENSIKIFRQLKARKKPSSELIVCGCLPKINNSRLREVYQGVTFGSDDIEMLAKNLELTTIPRDAHANYLLPFTEDARASRWHMPNCKKLSSFMDLEERLTMGYYKKLCQAINVFHPYSFCIKVSTGCLNACAYCAVKFSRGNTKSKPIETVAREFDEGLAKGYKEFSLLGTDLGSYGKDQGYALVDLLKELTARNGEYHIRLRNIQPRFLSEMLPDLQVIFQSGKITYLGSAAESGNNRILKLMNRGYSIEDYKNAIRTINREFPDIQISTQLMAGFPGETEREFQDTIRLLDELHFDLAETYLFESRPNTRAAKMTGQIPRNVARRRAHKLFMKSMFNQRERKKKALKEYKAALDSFAKARI